MDVILLPRSQPDRPRITGQGRSCTAIVLGEQPSPFYCWLGHELQRYLRQLSGAQVPIMPIDDIPADTGLLVVGDPTSHGLVRLFCERAGMHPGEMKPGGYRIEPATHAGRPALFLMGNDEQATMYAVYDLLEQLGLVFQLTGDIIPQTKPELLFPEAGVRREPALKYRGLHMRHFVMPWMGMAYFQRLLDQLAKMRCNYLEFYAYVGSPWFQYANNDGETKLLGDIYTAESGFTSWRLETGTFTTGDVVIGREHFHDERPCAPEFQHCRTQEEAYRIARQLLTRVIDYAHSRKIEVWLGKGDCPGVPANLGRHARSGQSTGAFGRIISPADPLGMEIWTAMLESMLRDYPRADGYWLWLAEMYYRSDDPEAQQIIARYAPYRQLIPSIPKIRAMGYDQYLEGMEEQVAFESDVASLHYAKSLIDAAVARHPHARFGVSVLGRAYLLPALDALLPRGVALQSMEAAPCWNRGARVPMENFGKVSGRELFVVPRLDDDEHEFAMQFNVGLYDHDRVIPASVQFGLAGAIPQVGKTRGLEQNARFLAEAPWNTELTPAAFYQEYITRIFGERARTMLCEAYRMLEENELFLGLHVDTARSGHCFQGMGNFCNYADSLDLAWLKLFRGQTAPFDGPNFPGCWDVHEAAPARLMQLMHYREGRFAGSVTTLQAVLELLTNARSLVLPGAREELEYLIYKTACFILHLNTLRALMQGFMAYDAAFRAKAAGRTDDMLARLDDCEYFFEQSCALAAQTAERVASLIDDPTERHILFRYNVRIVLPFREFRKFIANVVNFHRGQPYWQKVNWDVIDMYNAS